MFKTNGKLSSILFVSWPILLYICPNDVSSKKVIEQENKFTIKFLLVSNFINVVKINDLKVNFKFDLKFEQWNQLGTINNNSCIHDTSCIEKLSICIFCCLRYSVQK